MGLDMYLQRAEKQVVDFLDYDIDELKTNKPDVYETLKPFIVINGNPEYFTYESLTTKVGYWRKANQIHNWFVENVQDGIDNCENHEVSKEKLQELLDTCNKVFDSCTLIKGTIENGYRITQNGCEPILEEGEYIEDSVVAEILLPTTQGCFFGSTNYDQYYYEDIKHTIDILQKVLSETDFDKQVIIYRSSW